MHSEVQIIISFLFKRSGKKTLTFSELYLPLSIDLKWFTPNEAKDFVNSALRQGFLIEDGDLLKPNFDYTKINLPVNFHPSKIQTEVEVDSKDKKSDVVKFIINQIVKLTNHNENIILDEIKEISENRKISIEVASLLVGLGYNVVIDSVFDQIEDNIFIDTLSN